MVGIIVQLLQVPYLAMMLMEVRSVQLIACDVTHKSVRFVNLASLTLSHVPNWPLDSTAALMAYEVCGNRAMRNWK